MFDFSFNCNSNDVHNIHPYPAKFPPSVPFQLLKKISNPGNIVLDPFCGSGTTLVEGLGFDCNVIGNDINYIALLISQVKTTNYCKKDFIEYEKDLQKIIKNFQIRKNIDNPTYFKNMKHWFQSNVCYELDIIKEIIKSIKIKKQRKMFELVFSSIIIDVSNQESDTRYASKNKNIQDGFTINLFKNKYYSIQKKLLNFDYKKHLKAKILNEDARNLKSIYNNSIDIIITSPPYANTYDYYLYHKHRMNWLDFDFNISKRLEIGSRNEYSSKKNNIDKWIQDIESFMREMKRVTKKDGFICIVIGDSVINKKMYNSLEIIMTTSKKLKLKYIYSDSVSLSQNSKKFNHKFRTPLDKQEHIVVLQNESRL
jgi:site-specific DNA-methyltransferase (cytosine-N4-specific)